MLRLKAIKARPKRRASNQNENVMADIVTEGIGRIASSGTLIGAAMETAGHHTQSQMLEIVAGPGGMKIAALLYLIAILGALISLASGGSYRFGIWLLIGPPLFFYLINVRAPSDGVQWRFGQRIHPNTEVEKGTRGVGGGEGGPGNVSAFFLAWDKLTSGIVQGLIEMTHLTDNGSDLDFVSKTDRYMQMFDDDTVDPLLKGFINATLVNRCSDFIAAKKTQATTFISDQQKESTQKIIDAHGKNNPVFNLNDEPALKNMLQKLFGANLERLQAKPADGKSFTCMDLWRASVEAYKEIGGEGFIDLLTRNNLPEGLTPEQAKEKLMWKFGMQVGNGEVVNDNAAGGAGADDAALTNALNELAARLIFKELSKVNPSLVALEMDEHPQLMLEGGRQFDEGTSRALRTMQSGDEFQYKGELIIAALTLPYIQGVILYFLCVAFPFFAACMLMPGRHHGFLLWMGLWLWAKLWDFGFAVVMLVDNMLYALMPHGPPMTDQQISDPGTAFKTLLEVDPTYSVGTYYSLLSCCMLAVPVLTGMIVHKGGREFIETFAGTFRDYPTKYGTSVAAYRRSLNAQHSLQKARTAEWSAVESGAWRTFMSDNELQSSLARRVLYQAIKNNTVGGLSDAVKNKTGFSGAVIDGLVKNGAAGLDAAINFEKNRAQQMMKTDLMTLGYNVSKADYSLEMAGEAVLNNFNSHHFVRNFPWQAINDKRSSDHQLPLGKGADATLDAWYKRFIGN